MIRKGFVMAMQGEMVIQGESRAAIVRRLAPTWFLTSRCGLDGRLLLIGWTGRATVDTPGFVPRRTLVALLRPGRAAGEEGAFTLLPACPDGITVAGRVQPAEGVAYLWKLADRRIIHVEARLPGGQSCSVSAMQCPWMGEVDEDD